MSFLSELSNFKKEKLNPTEVIETDRQGRKWRVTITQQGQTKELVGENLNFKETFKDGVSYPAGTEHPNHFYLFDKEQQTWVIYDDQHRDLHDDDTDQKKRSLKLITFNVWFSQYYMKERADALFGYCDEENADIICFQEVTDAFLTYLLEQSWARERYLIVDAPGEMLGVYGIVIMVNLDVKKASYFELPTKMGRKTVIAEVSVNGHDFKVGTVHLESMEESITRLKQLEIIADKLGDDNTIFCGDFNIDGYASEENMSVVNTFPNHDDAWPSLHGDEPGFTYTNEENSLAWERVERLDRVLVSKSSDIWTLESIEIIGKFPCDRDEEEQKDIYISDHFGLQLKLTLK